VKENGRLCRCNCKVEKYKGVMMAMGLVLWCWGDGGLDGVESYTQDVGDASPSSDATETAEDEELDDSELDRLNRRWVGLRVRRRRAEGLAPSLGPSKDRRFFDSMEGNWLLPFMLNWRR
jgi:hypothetical protein